MSQMAITDLGRVARGISAPGPHRSVLDSLPSHGSCHPVHQEYGTQAQWANNRGYWAVTRSQQALAFLADASRLYFLRSHVAHHGLSVKTKILPYCPRPDQQKKLMIDVGLEAWHGKTW